MRDRSEPFAFRDNFRGPLPWSDKLRLAARNTWLKVRTRQACCGHPGEPGC
jgi:hypothetical protein